MHSYCYSHPDYNPLVDGGPRINILLTHLSRFVSIVDDIGIPGMVSQSFHNDADPFTEFVSKFKKELINKLHKDMNGEISLEMIRRRVDAILPQ